MTAPDAATLRLRHQQAGLAESDLPADPFETFAAWFAEVVAVPLPEPNAMVLATADASGRPSARTVLLKAYDARGFVFFTNYRSRKGQALAENPQASLLFPWWPLGRQVEVNGPVRRVSRAETAAYFATRPRGAQLGAWASAQSSVIPDRAFLLAALAEQETRWAGREVPAPANWGGLRVVPETVEFWQGRPDRLHDRIRYRRNGRRWLLERLSP